MTKTSKTKLAACTLFTDRSRSHRNPQVNVSNAMRLQLLIMITEFGLSCYQTARILNLPYTNAKVIYRTFREEKRIASLRNFAKTPSWRDELHFLRQNFDFTRAEASKKIARALKSDLLTTT